MNNNTNDDTSQIGRNTINQQYGQPWYPPEDEISLLDLWKVLVDRRKVIFLFTTLATVVALIHALTSPAVYKAEIFFLPPAISDIQSLNIQNIQNMRNMRNMQKMQNMQKNMKGVTVQSVYTLFKQNLGSKSFQRDFFNMHTNLEDDLLDDFSKSLQINAKKKSNKLSLTFEWSNAQQAANLINEYSQVVGQKTVHQLITNLKQTVSNRIYSIEYEIASKRKMAKQRREDKIAKLLESLRIAVSLEQHKQTSQQDVGNSPLYYRGSNALKIEIDILNERKSDDPFIEGLRDLQEELAMLHAINVDKAKLRAVTIDQQAYPPEFRIKPKRKLIVTLGLVLGLMLGIFAAFIVNFRDNQKTEDVP